MKKCAYL